MIFFERILNPNRFDFQQNEEALQPGILFPKRRLDNSIYNVKQSQLKQLKVNINIHLIPAGE